MSFPSLIFLSFKLLYHRGKSWVDQQGFWSSECQPVIWAWNWLRRVRVGLPFDHCWRFESSRRSWLSNRNACGSNWRWKRQRTWICWRHFNNHKKSHRRSRNRNFDREYHGSRHRWTKIQQNPIFDDVSLNFDCRSVVGWKILNFCRPIEDTPEDWLTIDASGAIIVMLDRTIGCDVPKRDNLKYEIMLSDGDNETKDKVASVSLKLKFFWLIFVSRFRSTSLMWTTSRQLSQILLPTFPFMKMQRLEIQ